jgi:hypothetical protein
LGHLSAWERLERGTERMARHHLGREARESWKGRGRMGPLEMVRQKELEALERQVSQGPRELLKEAKVRRSVQKEHRWG